MLSPPFQLLPASSAAAALPGGPPTPSCRPWGPPRARAHAPMELGGKKKLHALSLAEKVQVLALLAESKLSQSEVARRFRVSQPQISRICKNRDKLLADWRSGTANRQRKRKRESKYSGLDEALLGWFRLARARAGDVTGPVLLQKAKELADRAGQAFVPSIGWLVRWKRRNNVCMVPRPPRAHQPPAPARLLRDFPPQDIFGCGELPLLYRTLPGAGAGAGPRVQVALCANGTGTEKRKAVVVGRRGPPPGADAEALPALYRAGRGGRVTPELVSEWLADFDWELGRQGRTVALLLDPEWCCPDPVPTNIRVVFAPRGDAPCPLHPAVARDFKARYKRQLLAKAAARGTAPVTLLDALHMVAAAWEAVEPTLLARCFADAGHEAPEVPPPPGLTPAAFRRYLDLESEGGAPALPPPCKEEEEEEEERGEEGEGPGEVPSRDEALRALGTLRRWLEARGAPDTVFRHFYACEEEVERDPGP